jgi:hypothetical protein
MYILGVWPEAVPPFDPDSVPYLGQIARFESLR